MSEDQKNWAEAMALSLANGLDAYDQYLQEISPEYAQEVRMKQCETDKQTYKDAISKLDLSGGYNGYKPNDEGLTRTMNESIVALGKVLSTVQGEEYDHSISTAYDTTSKIPGTEATLEYHTYPSKPRLTIQNLEREFGEAYEDLCESTLGNIPAETKTALDTALLER